MPSKMRARPLALGLESQDLLLRVNKKGPCLTAIDKDGDNERLVDVEVFDRKEYPLTRRKRPRGAGETV